MKIDIDSGKKTPIKMEKKIHQFNTIYIFLVKQK